jgi:hypothetical protein
VSGVTLRHLVASTLIALVCAAPASAGVKQKVRAANAVERKLNRKYSGYRWTAYCRQPAPRSFDCKFVGRRDQRGGFGDAGVLRVGKRYFVTLGPVAFS